jgi:hypothetical protein
VILRSPSGIKSDWVEQWLERWGWIGKVERTVLHSAGASHYVIIKPSGLETRELEKSIRVGWRGEMIRRKSPKRSTTAA